MIRRSDDTIAAPATAPGGALAVIRISGPRAFACCQPLFRSRQPIADAPGNTILYGTVRDGQRIVDDVLLAVFRAPRSYTGEDSVEISCHGSPYIVSEILRLLAEQGARPAEPGEFTMRAFLAGKLDLSQAEAVADLIAASSRAAHAMASTQIRGGYSSDLETLRGELLRLAALLELELDFAEEDVEFADRTQLRDAMERIRRRIRTLIGSFDLGNVLKEGIPVAIVGRPNTGKSTLLNRLLNEERALVSEIPGTTRDTIEERICLDGILFRFIDTAGLRATDDRVERMGIERTRSCIRKARIVLQLIDATDPAFEPIEIRPGQRRLVVLNKSDLARPETIPDGTIAISAKTGDGIDTLRSALSEGLSDSGVYQGDTIISNARHLEALRQAETALERALSALDRQISADLLSEEIRQVSFHLGTITGQVTTDEILGSIFSTFCIGK